MGGTLPTMLESLDGCNARWTAPRRADLEVEMSHRPRPRPLGRTLHSDNLTRHSLHSRISAIVSALALAPALTLVLGVMLPASAEARASRLLRDTAIGPPPKAVVVILAQDAAARNPEIASLLTSQGVDRIETLSGTSPSARAAGLTLLKLSGSSPDFDAVRVAAALRASGGVRAAAPDVPLRLFAVPNDSFYVDQWFLQSSQPGDINLPEAWDLEQGSASTVIAIMDNSVDTSHPDLASKIWTNPGEIPGNSLDDDGNGFVDDVTGWDFGDEDNDPRPHPIFDEIGIDIAFHGTHCAGLAAAATNNNDGVAGSGWNCSILPLKIASSAGTMLVSDASEAFFYAADMGADVLSMSFGTLPDSGVGGLFQALVDMATGAGVACVAAAGNEGTSIPIVPASNTGVLSVGASDDVNGRASFSNYGPWVKVAAPGVLMLSCIQQNYVLDDLNQIVYQFFFGWDGVNPYMYSDGTSMATPLVAGVVGLVRSRFPTMTPAQAIQRVIDTGDVVAYDQPIGRKVNAFQAVNGTVAVGDPPPGGGAEIRLLPALPSPFRGSTTLRFSLPASSSARLAVYGVSGALVRELARGTFPAGTHAEPWDGLDANGRAAGPGLYFVLLDTPAGRVTQRVVRIP